MMRETADREMLTIALCVSVTFCMQMKCDSKAL